MSIKCSKDDLGWENKGLHHENLILQNRTSFYITWLKFIAAVFRIHIGSGFNQDSGSLSGSGFGIRIRIEGQKWPTKIEKPRNFMFWSAGCTLLRAEGHFRSLEVFYGGPEIGKLQFFILKKYRFFFQLWFFLSQFLVIKTLDPDWTRIGIQPKMLDPSPNQMNTDPKHCIADHLFPARKSTQLVN
jgi:hypothetical protein